MALGGLVGGTSSTQILAGPPAHLTQCRNPPTATHDDAAVTLGRYVYLLGGGQVTSSDAVVRVSATGRAVHTGSLGEPLSDLGAAVIGNTAYLVGGYTGTQYATGVLAFRGGTPHWSRGFRWACATRASPRSTAVSTSRAVSQRAVTAQRSIPSSRATHSSPHRNAAVTDRARAACCTRRRALSDRRRRQRRPSGASRPTAR